MATMQSKKKYKRPSRQRKIETPSSFNLKLFVALGLLLVVLLMKKYDLAIGDFNVDSLYKVVYYNEDLNALKEKVFFFNTNNNNADDVMQNIPSDDIDNAITPDESSIPNSQIRIIDQQETLPIDETDAKIENEISDEEVTNVENIDE